MTHNQNFKRRVRSRANKTGESYTAALRHVRAGSRHDPSSEARSVRLAVAQTTLCDDPRDAAALRAGGEALRRLMQRAAEAGARIVHFGEGAICSPNKRIMSSTGPDEIGPSDWGRYDWGVFSAELERTRGYARELGIWVVFGAVHRLSPPHRPHNSLHVVSDRGELVTRYDERLLSNTKISFMYAPGSVPVTFEVDGVSFGCALGMETHFPEIFTEYERLDVDCVLFSSTGDGLPHGGGAFAAEAQGHAASNSYCVSFAVLARHSPSAPAGIVGPNGRWLVQCPADGTPAVALADITTDPADPSRPWRRTARTGIYEPHFVAGDPRSDRRNSF
jgi:predicted amidohydrolase